MTIIEKEVGFCGLPRADALAMTGWSVPLLVTANEVKQSMDCHGAIAPRND